jgi:hypothetical protein
MFLFVSFLSFFNALLLFSKTPHNAYALEFPLSQLIEGQAAGLCPNLLAPGYFKVSGAAFGER